MKSTTKKSPTGLWRVVCVLGDGQPTGDCGHDHRSALAAARCRYAPRAYKRDVAAELRVVPLGGRR